MLSTSSSNEQSDNSSKAMKQAQQPHRCIYCGQHAELVWVHGHGQCAACGINTDECCRGESCGFDQ